MRTENFVLAIVLLAAFVWGVVSADHSARAADKPLTIIVERLDDSQTRLRKFHINREVVSEMELLFESPQVAKECRKVFYDGEERQMPEAACRLAQELYSIEGISSVFYIRRYQVHLQRGEAFSWDELEGQVIEALKKHFQSPEAEVKIKEPPKATPAPCSDRKFYQEW